MATHESPSPYWSGTDDILDEATHELSPFEHFAAILNETVDALKRNQVAPNTTTREFSHAAFGRFGDGHLSASMTNDNGYWTGSITFIGAEDDTRGSFVGTHRIADGDTWTLDDKRTINLMQVAKRLHANWPQFLVDNTQATRLVDMEASPSIEQIATLLDTYLASHAQSRRTEEAYLYRSILVDGIRDTVRDTSLAVNVEEDGNGFRRIEVLIQQPFEINDATSVPIRCRVVLDEMNELSSISTQYTDPYTDKKMSPKVNDPDMWFEEIERRLAELLQEKLGPLGN